MRKEFIFLFILILISLPFIHSEFLDKEETCEKVYLAFQSSMSTEDLIQKILYEDKIYINKETIEYYKDNWNEICSLTIGKSLNEKKICEDVYYLILSSDYNYSSSDLLGISKEAGVSVQLIEIYLLDYYDSCYLKGYSEQLPEQKFPKLILEETEKCDLEKSSFKEVTIPISIPLKEVRCSDVQFWNNFFKYDEFHGYYTFKGIRLYFLGIVLGVGFLFTMVIIFVKSNIGMNKILGRNT